LGCVGALVAWRRFLLKIGDFSQLGQASVRTLHHYDERGDDWTGYRFYSVEQFVQADHAPVPADVHARQ